MSILETVISTTSGGSFALLGGWLAYKYNSRSIKENRDFEKWKSNRDLYLSKGQELSDLFGIWVTASLKLTNIYLFRASGIYNEGQYNERVKEINSEGFLPRMLSLVSIYFPGSIDGLEKLQRIMAESHYFYVKNVDLGGDNPKVVAVLNSAMEDFSKQSKIFKNELVKEIKRHI